MSAPDHYVFVVGMTGDGNAWAMCAGHMVMGVPRYKRKLAAKVTAGHSVPDARVRICNEAGGLLGSHPSIYKLAGRK